MKIKFWQALIVWSLLAASSPLEAQVVTVRHEFTNVPDGSRPRSVVLSSNTFYGVTINGGSLNNGMIFKYPLNGGAFTPLFPFDGGTNGSAPNDLIVDGGTIYGTTQSGGTNSFGTIYAVNTNGGSFSVLHAFTNQPDGQTPKAALVMAGGTLFGTAAFGGTDGRGTVFKLSTNGSGYVTLRNFTNGVDGQNPFGGLMLNGATLYGTTAYGGTYGNGTVFKIDTNGGNYAILYSFSNSPDAQFPYAGLVMGSNSNVLYGTTSLGGNGDSGVVFSINTNGSAYTILHHFTNSPDGSSPQSALLLSGGALYGSSVSGGKAGFGTLFTLKTNGANFQILKNFTNSPDGANPQCVPVIVSNIIWATSLLGGPAQDGKFFSMQLLPAILSHPQNLNVTNGNPATLSVTAAVDESALTYQWYFNTNTILNGQTNSSLFFASATTNNTGFYTASVTDAFGSVTSTPALLTVVPGVPSQLPVISSHPQNLQVTNATPATFKVTATGASSYQWYFNTNTLLAGQTATNLVIASATTNNAGTYTVVLTNNAGAVTSSPAVLTVVVPGPPPLPNITSQPQNLTVTNGTPAAFSVTANNASGYQWYFNTNTLLAGKTASTLTIASASTNDIGNYRVVVTNSAGSVTSSAALLTLVFTNKPVLISQPKDLQVSLGGVASFTVVALGQSPLSYQWYSNSVANQVFTNPKRVNGETNATYSFTASFTNTSFYYVVVTNIFGKATNTISAQLTVVTAPLITSNPQPASVNNGSPASFTVGVLGASVLKYQWYFNTNNAPAGQLGSALAGQTNVTLAFAAASNSMAGRYSVIITNTYGKATSSPPAVLTVLSNNPLPVITLQPSGASITNGDFVSFTSAATGSGTLNYQWLFQTNLPVAGATNTTFVITNANQPGAYSMKATDNFGSATSSPAILIVAGTPIMRSSAFDAASGSFVFSYVNLAGSTNRLWASTNLVSTNFWKAIATNIMATNALWFYTDANAARTNDQRFYRFSTP